MSGETSRELDALRLMAGVLRGGDTVAELGPCAHSLTTLDGLADDVQVCSAQAQLASLSSLAWLRLASRAALSEEVQQAIGRHRPRILLGAPESESVEELLAALGAPGYCAMARVGAFLFLAPETDCQPPVSAKRASMVDPLRAVFGHARTIGLTGMQLVQAKRQRRGLRDTVKHYRPPTVFARKLVKLTTDPQRFLRDAKSPILHGPAATTMAMLFPAKARSASRRETTVFDLPKRSILVFAGPDISKDLESWLRLCEPLTLATELVVVADAGHHAFFEALLARALSPRMRVYLVAEPLSGQELLEYGIARCYASNLALVQQLGENSAEAISEALAQLRDDAPYWLGDQPQLIAAKRNRLRDQASEELRSSELADALDGMASRIQISGTEEKLNLVGGTHFFAYSTIAPRHSFFSIGGQRVFCLEKRPHWALPVSTMVRNQQPKVSVIMTVYNAATTLPAAVASVLGQSYANLELLVIDDGSDDGSLALLLALAEADSRLSVLQTANNSGTYFAKNVGLSFAQGHYVTFHDSDDISAGNRLELQVEALDCDPLAIANYTRYQRISEEGREVWFGGQTNRPGYITLLFRREQVLAAVGFFDSVRMSADAELVNRLRVATQRSVSLLPAVSYYALQAEGSLTTAGAGAFAMAGDGSMAMPPIRQQYREAADAWQAACYEGLAQAHIPFPLGQRPFDAPYAMRPDRGYSELSERLLTLAIVADEEAMVAQLAAELESYGEKRLEAKVLQAIEQLATRKRVKDCRKLFLAVVETCERARPRSGLSFADRNLQRLDDIPSALAIARRYADLGCIKRPIAIFEEYVPEERRGPFYDRLVSQEEVLADGVQAQVTLDLQPQTARERHFLYHINQSLPFHPNGYALRTQYLLSAMARIGWLPTAATRFGYPVDRPDFDPTWQVSTSAEIDEVSYLYSPDTSGVRGLTASEQHVLLVRSLAKVAVERRPSLIHSASNHVTGLSGARVARELGIPSVYEMRGLWHMTRSAGQPEYDDSDHYRMIERLEVQAAQESDFVLTLTLAMKELLVDAGVRPEKIALLPNAVDTDQFVVAPPPVDLVRAYGLEGKVGIGFIGSMSEYEGLDLLIAAIATLRERSDFHVILVGDGSTKPNLEELVSRLELQNRISFVGRVPHEQVHSYYALLDILVYPRTSRRVCEYVSPLKPFEALAQEKAVIVSSVRALAEIVDHERTGLVFEKGDASSLAQALRRLLDDVELRARLGKQGREQVLAHHSWQHRAEQLQEVYDRLLCSSAT